MNRLDLSRCSEFHQILLRRPPRFVHGAAFLLGFFLLAVFVWSAVVRADVVVRSRGRIRPIFGLQTDLSSVSGERIHAAVEGRVAEVRPGAGDLVRQGDVLVRWETDRLENEIARRERTLQALRDEIATLERLRGILASSHAAAHAKAQAELQEAEEEIRRRRAQQRAAERLATLELEQARAAEARARSLWEREVVSEAEYRQSVEARRRCEEKLAEARIPVAEGRRQSAQRSLESVKQEYAAKREELEIRVALQKGAVESGTREVENLRIDLAQCTIRAPRDGVVTACEVKTGDTVRPGQFLMAIAPDEGFRMDLALSGEDVGSVHVGMEARILLDAYDAQEYGTLSGTVLYVAPDSKTDAQTGRSYYLVRIGIPVRAIERGTRRGPLRFGMAGTADIRTDRKSVLSLWTTRVRHAIRID